MRQGPFSLRTSGVHPARLFKARIPVSCYSSYAQTPAPQPSELVPRPSLSRTLPSSIRQPSATALLRRSLVTTSIRRMPSPTPWTPGQYPKARISDHVDVYKSKKSGSVSVSDPYEWLEHDTPEREAWINAQADFTEEYLKQNPDRKILEDEIRKNTDYAKVKTYCILIPCFVDVNKTRLHCSSRLPA